MIVGPTASGKSALAVGLARRFGGEIVSADSRQVYKGLDIGTGKIMKREMRGVPHHLLDVANPKRQYSVARYVRDARRAIAAIARRGHLPIVCGGTGHYIDALLGVIQIPEVPPDHALRKRLEKKSPPELFAILKKFDPRRAKTIDPHNPRRLIRAVEIAYADNANRKKRRLTQIGKSQTIKEYDVLWIGLKLSLEKLRHKITIRLFARISEYNMLGEAARLHREGLSWKRMDALGLEYRYLAKHLRGIMTKKEMTEKLETEIWRYAKRQMQWFKRNKEIHWVASASLQHITPLVRSFIRS